MKAGAAQPSGRSYPGTVEEGNRTALSFASPGTVESVHVSLGQHVRRGQLIATLNTTSARNAYNGAHAALEQAEDAQRRMEELHKRGSLPDIKWVEVQSRVEQARSAERIAAKNLDDCRLLAPFSGVVASKNAEAGQNVLPGTPVVSLVTASELKVRVSVPEAEVGSLATGTHATFTVPALSGQTFHATVAEKNIVANPLTRSYEVKLRVQGRHDGLLPGMVANVSFAAQAADSTGSLALPAAVVQIDEDNRTFVWVAERGRAHKRFVSCGGYTAGGVEVLAGLSPNDDVIVEGQHKVCEGTEVKP